jgi:hypothetical protein
MLPYILKQPTRSKILIRKTRKLPSLCAYLVLLRVGFTMRILLLRYRYALTAPFHPYSCSITLQKRYIFCGTFPKVTLAGRYPAPFFRGVRTFLVSKIRSHATIRVAIISVIDNESNDISLTVTNIVHESISSQDNCPELMLCINGKRAIFHITRRIVKY